MKSTTAGLPSCGLLSTMLPDPALMRKLVWSSRAVESAGFESPVVALEDRELRSIMKSEIRRLPEREKLVLSLYYDESLTLAEIGEVLGVTESRVSQIHTKSVLHLRSRMTAVGIG